MDREQYKKEKTQSYFTMYSKSFEIEDEKERDKTRKYAAQMITDCLNSFWTQERIKEYNEIYFDKPNGSISYLYKED